jgi:hypothetical protein
MLRFRNGKRRAEWIYKEIAIEGLSFMSYSLRGADILLSTNFLDFKSLQKQTTHRPTYHGSYSDYEALQRETRTNT